MLRRFQNVGRIAALLVFGSSFLLAQEKGLGFDFKFRVANAPSTNDHLNSMAFGFGLNSRYTSDWGTLNGELGFYYKPGRQYLATYDAPADPTIPPVAGSSVDSRKNSLSQVNARLSYEKAFNKEWSWQAGLQVGQARFRHEYVGDLGNYGPPFQFEDTYNGTPTKSVFTLSPFVGVSYQINKDSAFELNLISLSYTATEFHHTPGAAIVSGDPNTAGSHLVYAGDRFEDHKRNALHIEIGYTFRF